MLRHRTQLLALLVLLAAGASLLAYWRLDNRRAEALAGERDLRTVHHDLADIALSTGGNRRLTAKADPSDLVRRVADVAAIAGVQLTTREPGIPQRLGTSEYNELPVFLGFESITLRQLTVFLNQLALSDPGSRAKMIELRPREPGATGPAGPADGELWTADVTIAYLVYAPKETKLR